MKKKWFFDNLKLEASKFSTKGEFRENSPIAYRAALKNPRYEEIVSHMPKYLNSCGENGHNLKWSNAKIQEEALKFNTRGDFQKYSVKIYRAAKTRGILKQVCSHMKMVRTYWTNDMLRQEAIKYGSRSQFALNNSSAYVLAKNRNILDEICSHMQFSTNTSSSEINLFDFIKSIYPKAQKLKDRKVKILNKPHIQGFEIDIYIPELRKGVEFDGKYYHSLNGLKRGRPNWPQTDIEQYHQIKDQWFASKGIKILHIREEDWLKNSSNCLDKCLKFLNTVEVR